MAKPRVYLEIGRRRVFAFAIEWPGWCRSGRDEDAALQALMDYGPRYGKAIGRAAAGFVPPSAVAAIDVVERLSGDASTDFGAPGIPPAADARAVTEAELDRLITLLKAAWAAFDESARAAVSAVLRKGPRGGGRELPGIVEHVLGGDGAYLHRLGGQYHEQPGIPVDERMAQVRSAVIEAVKARARGDPSPHNRRARLWTPRYGIRRSAWHALDHAWEIEDRAHR